MNREAAVELLRRRARVRLLDFVRWCWSQPGPFKVGRHTRAFCEWFDRAVERWERGESSFCLFNCPPRHGKSELCNYAAAYFLGRESQWEPSEIYTGYGFSLVQRFSRNIQAIIRSEAYRALFPEVRLDPRNRAVDTWRIDGSHGFFTATGLGGSLTGKGGHLLIVDDYCKSSEEAESEVYREKTWEAFSTDFFTRQMAPAAIVVVVATPWHMDDLTCRIRRRVREDADFPKFDELCFPAVCDEWETLFPEFLDASWYGHQRATLGPQKWAALFLCNPIGDGMRLFRDEWIHQYSTVPTGTANYIFVDTAGSKKRKNNDYLVMWVVGVGQDGNFYVLDLVRDRMNLSERTRVFFELVRKWKPRHTFWEQVGAQTDLEHIELEMDRQTWHTPVTAIDQKVPKEGRILWLQPLFEQGRIWLPTRVVRQRVDGRMEDMLNTFFEDEYKVYPSVAHDDMLDCLANLRHPAVLGMLEKFRSPYGYDGREAHGGESYVASRRDAVFGGQSISARSRPF